MISARVYKGGAVTEIDSARIATTIKDHDALLWVDVADPSDDDLACLQQEFGLHHLAIEDVQHRFQRPKLDQYRGHILVVIHSRREQEVDVFAAPNWLISVRERCDHSDPGWSIDNVTRRIERSDGEDVSSGFLLYLILDEIVDGYFDALDAGEDVLESLEEKVFAEEPLSESQVQRDLFHARRRLLRFRRSVGPLHAVISSLLRGEVAWIDGETKIHLQDVLDHVLRVVDSLDNARDLLGNIMDAHLAIISNRMNRVMKKMTSWGAILLVSALVSSIYGMNFVHMPELKWRYGYVYALSLMAVIALAGYAYFKKKDWL